MDCVNMGEWEEGDEHPAPHIVDEDEGAWGYQDEREVAREWEWILAAVGIGILVAVLSWQGGETLAMMLSRFD